MDFIKYLLPAIGFLAFYYIGLNKIFLFNAAKSYDYNYSVYMSKSTFGYICGFIMLALLGISGGIVVLDWFKEIGWGNVLIWCIWIGFLLFAMGTVVIALSFEPILTLNNHWETYNLENFPTTLVGRITKCEPNKIETQDNHYKKVSLDTACTVSVGYTYEGKYFTKQFKEEPNKIIYTYLPDDTVELVISTKNPQFVELMKYCFDRPITDERYKELNYGSKVEESNSDDG